jgi:hypothetical protein
MLLTANIVGEASEFGGSAPSEKLEQQDVLALQNGISFQFRHPVALRLLAVKEIALGLTNSVTYGLQRDRAGGEDTPSYPR